MKKIALLSALLIGGMLSAGTIEVRTAPDGYYDSRVGTIFSDAPFQLSLYSWVKAGQKPFTASDVRLEITLPEQIDIYHYALCRRARGKDGITAVKTADGKKKWTLDFNSVPFRAVYRRVGGYCSLPWTESVFILFIRPSGKVPAYFEAPWKITGTGLDTASGTMKLATLPAPKLEKAPKRISVHSSTGMFGDNSHQGAWTRESFLAMLGVMKNAGVTVLEETGGMWMPECIVPGTELQKMGFTLEYMGAFNYPQRTSLEDMKLFGYPVREQDMMVDIRGIRLKKRSDQKAGEYIYCPTAMTEKDSPVRAWIEQRYRELMDRGFTMFYDDTEPRGYAFCYCDKCRKVFAAEEKLPENEILAMQPVDLVKKYPVKWYLFQSRSFARVFSLLNKALKTPIGVDSTLGVGKFYIPEYRSAGLVNWAEDPRQSDEFVAYHDADTLCGGVGSIYEADLFFQRYPDGSPMLKKPIIVRSTSFEYVHTWVPSSVFGRIDDANEKGKILGLDKRGVSNALSVANVIALGASGVRVYQDFTHADAASFTGVTNGLRFAAEFEDNLRFENRLNKEPITLFDCTETPSPYKEKMKNATLGKAYYHHSQTFGEVQSTVHRKDSWMQVSLFNWDVYQDKKIRVSFSELPEGKLYVNLWINGRKYTRPQPLKGKELSLDLPAGAVCAVVLSPEKMYPVMDDRCPSYLNGKKIRKYYPGNINKGLEPFMERVYNYSLQMQQRCYPELKMPVVPVKNRMDYWRF